MGFASIVEVEFGAEHEREAGQLIRRLRKDFGAVLTEKAGNKICYALNDDRLSR